MNLKELEQYLQNFQKVPTKSFFKFLELGGGHNKLKWVVKNRNFGN